MIETLLLPLLGRELFSKVFNETSNNVYNGLEELKKYNHYNLDNLIEQLDIQNKMKIIESYIKKREDNILEEHIKLSINSIINIIEKINEEIKDINTQIIEHELKWFPSYRKPDIKNKINNLINHSLIFDKRLDLMFKI